VVNGSCLPISEKPTTLSLGLAWIFFPGEVSVFLQGVLVKMGSQNVVF
jgi:hypothetical protein